MAVTPEILADLLSKIEIDSDQTEDVRKLRSAVVSVPFSQDLTKLINPDQFERYVYGLKTNSRERLYITCDLLRKVLARLDPVTILNSYEEELLLFFNHPEPMVKLLVLEQIERFVISEQALTKLAEDSEITSTAIKLIGDPNLNVYKRALEVVVKMVQTEKGLHLLKTAQLIAEIQALMQLGESIKFRIYELTVEICKISPLHLTCCVEIGTLPALVSELKDKDVVVKLKCLELLGEVGSRDYGIKFLEEQGAIKEAEKMLNKVDTDYVMSYLAPGLVKFFGNMVRVHPKEVIDKYPKFVSCLLELLPDEYNYPMKMPMKMDIVNLFGILGSTVEGKKALKNKEEEMSKCLIQLGSLIEDSIPEMQVNAIKAVASLLKLQIKDETEELLNLQDVWFSQLSDSSVSLVMDLCTGLNCKLNAPAWAIICAVGRQKEVLQETVSYFSNILYRKTTCEKEAEEMKYEYVRMLISSSETKKLPEYFIKQFKDFYKIRPKSLQKVSMLQYLAESSPEEL